MTQWLIHTFIRQPEETQDPAVRTAYGKLSSWVGIVCNLLLFLGKLLSGLFSGSVAIMADAVNNLSDASSSIVSLLGFKLASRPADEGHPYGHGRYEYLSGLTVAVLITAIGVELLRSSFQKVLHPEPVEFSWVFMAILAASILLKLWMAAFNRAMGRTIRSETQIATAADSRNDVITTSAVLAASLISHFTSLQLDGWIGLAVAVFILYSGFGLIRDTLDPLLGKAPDRQLVDEIERKILSYPGVLGTHDLMIHDYGPGRQFASVHVEMAAEQNVLESHDVIDNIERTLQKELGLHMIIHFDPIVTSDGTTPDLHAWLAEEVKKVHPSLTIHDLRVIPGPTHTNLIFDCVVPHDVNMTEREVKSAISALVKQTYPSDYCVITVDRSYAPVSE